MSKKFFREKFHGASDMVNQEELEKFSGEWILIFDDKIVDHSSDLGDILKSAEEYPVDEITIAKLPSPLELNPKLMEEEISKKLF
ncbi:MAG TPA: hypothetical protein ENG74_02720 [Thermoplasmatales archaeon]|nr:hypothetical protein [Thermoplasmatales archaeon]